MAYFVPDNAVAALEEWSTMVGLPPPIYSRAARKKDDLQLVVRCTFLSYKTYGKKLMPELAKQQAAGAMIKTIYFQMSDSQEFRKWMKRFQWATETGEQMTSNQLMDNPLLSLSEYCHQRGWSEPQYNYLGQLKLPLCAFECKVNNYSATGTGAESMLSKTNSALNMMRLLEENKFETDTYAQPSQESTEEGKAEVKILFFNENITESTSTIATRPTTPERTSDVNILYKNEELEDSTSTDSGIPIQIYQHSSSSRIDYKSLLDLQKEEREDTERANFLKTIVYSILLTVMFSIFVSIYFRYRNTE